MLLKSSLAVKCIFFFLSKKKSTQNKRLTFFTMGSDLWKTQPRQQCEHKTLLCRKRKGRKQNNVVLLLISHLMGATRMKWVPALDSRCEYAAKQYDYYYLFIFFRQRFSLCHQRIGVGLKPAAEVLAKPTDWRLNLFTLPSPSSSPVHYSQSITLRLFCFAIFFSA